MIKLHVTEKKLRGRPRLLTRDLFAVSKCILISRSAYLIRQIGFHAAVGRVSRVKFGVVLRPYITFLVIVH